MSELLFKKNEGLVQWESNGGKKISLNGSIDSALMDTDRNLVFLLINNEKSSALLQVFNLNGEQLVGLLPPEDFEFYYLSKHHKLGVSVVCVSEKKIDHWNDWHFGYDKENNELYRYCPAR